MSALVLCGVVGICPAMFLGVAKPWKKLLMDAWSSTGRTMEMSLEMSITSLYKHNARTFDVH